MSRLYIAAATACYVLAIRLLYLITYQPTGDYWNLGLALIFTIAGHALLFVGGFAWMVKKWDKKWEQKR